ANRRGQTKNVRWPSNATRGATGSALEVDTTCQRAGAPRVAGHCRQSRRTTKHCVSQRLGSAFAMLFQRVGRKCVEQTGRGVRRYLRVPRIGVERRKPFTKVCQFVRSERRNFLFDTFNLAHGPHSSKEVWFAPNA